MFLVRNKPAKEDLDGVTKEIDSFVEEIGGTIINSGKWDERKLAYDIAGERRGTYILYHFEAKPDGIARLERLCQISENVLRAMVVRDTDGTDLPGPGAGLAGGSAEQAPVAEQAPAAEAKAAEQAPAAEAKAADGPSAEAAAAEPSGTALAEDSADA